MPRLSKRDARDHDRALALVNGQTRLKLTDIDFVYDNYRPTNAAINSAFFTPRDVANDLSAYCDCTGLTVLDFCAGIGSLSQSLIGWGEGPRLIVLVEKDPELVRIGKRLLRSTDSTKVKWVCGDAYDKKLRQRLLRDHGRFDWMISNPPYGLNYKASDLNYNGRSELMAVEIAMKMADDALFILPQASVPWVFSFRPGYEEPPRTKNLTSFMRLNPDIKFRCTSIDMAVHKDAWLEGSQYVEMTHITTKE